MYNFKRGCLYIELFYSQLLSLKAVKSTLKFFVLLLKRNQILNKISILHVNGPFVKCFR